MDPTTTQAEPESQPPPGGNEPGTGGPEATEGEHWSPFSTSRARWAWGLMALYSVIYFVVAIVTSAEFAEFAAHPILGLPLGFYLGMGVIIAGLIITRVYLSKIER